MFSPFRAFILQIKTEQARGEVAKRLPVARDAEDIEIIVEIVCDRSPFKGYKIDREALAKTFGHLKVRRHRVFQYPGAQKAA